MRRITAILTVAAVVLMAAGPGAQAKPSFSGEWKKNAPMGQGSPGVDLIIKQDDTSMTVEDTRSQAPAKLTYKLDGSVSKNTVAGRGGAAPIEQVSKALWAGNNLVVTTTMSAGEEKRTFSMEGADLVVETSVRAGVGSPNISKATYKKYERGFGG